ncbi:MAG: RNA polymerase-binding protein RbpA [Candidatus Planktophila sp.]
MASAIRGSRVGAGPMGEAERGDQIERKSVSYWCAKGHEVRPSFAVEESVEIPAQWDCPKCGLPAGLDKNNPPSAVVNVPYKTHLAYVKERRSDAEGAQILEDALRKLRGDDID